MIDRLRSIVCALRGHQDAIFTFDRQRMFLACQQCGHESPGWDLKMQDNDLSRGRLLTLPLRQDLRVNRVGGVQ